MKKNFTTILLGVLVFAMMSSCVNSNKFNNNSNSESTAGLLYVINSGNPSFEDASLSIYDPTRKQVQNEAFADYLTLDRFGYADSDESCTTKTAGIFVAGDCRKKSIRQVATAAADGAIAALAACKYLDN